MSVIIPTEMVPEAPSVPETPPTPTPVPATADQLSYLQDLVGALGDRLDRIESLFQHGLAKIVGALSFLPEEAWNALKKRAASGDYDLAAQSQSAAAPSPFLPTEHVIKTVAVATGCPDKICEHETKDHGPVGCMVVDCKCNPRNR